MSAAYKELAEMINKSSALKELLQVINETEDIVDIKVNKFMRWLPHSLVDSLDKEEVKGLFENNPLR